LEHYARSGERTLDGNLTGRMLLDSARRLTVDAVLVRDAAELVDSLDRAGHDPDSRRVVNQLKEMGIRYSELARRLKLVALQFDDRIEREQEQPLRIDQIL